MKNVFEDVPIYRIDDFEWVHTITTIFVEEF